MKDSRKDSGKDSGKNSGKERAPKRRRSKSEEAESSPRAKMSKTSTNVNGYEESPASRQRPVAHVRPIMRVS